MNSQVKPFFAPMVCSKMAPPEGNPLPLRDARCSCFESDQFAACFRLQGTLALGLFLRRAGAMNYARGSAFKTPPLSTWHEVVMIL